MKRIIFLISILILAVCIVPPACYSNSAEPPSIIIIVPSAPGDLIMSIEPGDLEGFRHDKVLESYFAFYSYDLKSTDYTLKVTVEGRSFEVALNVSLRYNNIFTLDMEKQTLTPGESFFRSFNLTALRVVLTLLIEGLIFFLFGYRQKRSWLVFLIVNLVTQGFLNVWLTVSTSPMQSYLVLSLIWGEFLVFLAETAAMLIFVNEKRRGRTFLYVIAANAASLIVGGYLVMQLPV